MADSEPGRREIALWRTIEAFGASTRRTPLVRGLTWAARTARGMGSRGRVRRRSGTTLSMEGWYYLAVVAFVFTAAMLREMNLILVLVGTLIGPLLFSWRLVVATLNGLEVRRKMPHGVCAGDLLVVNVELANLRKRLGSWAVVVEEQISSEAGPGRGQSIRPSVFFGYVPRGESREGVYRGRLPQRGRYRFGPMGISTRFPFGLFFSRRQLKETETLIVSPRLGRLTQGWITRENEDFEGAQREPRRHSRTTGDFYGVRDWRSGDSRRWIHWRSSARHGTLVVRQFEHHRNCDVAVLVDLWQPTRPGAEDLENVEMAVSFAATVAADLCRRGGGNLLLAVWGDGPECMGGPASVALMQGAMERLAVAEASSEDRLPALLDCALGRVRPGTQVIVVGTRENDLEDSDRFGMVWRDPGRRAAIGRVRTVNAGGEELAEYFSVE
ncbi:MAG: DUF58 domain-containing protein [Planctomycetes bacterium]|nr:DUF58 domain-containing protein [Planctomycetota bacterium]